MAPVHRTRSLHLRKLQEKLRRLLQEEDEEAARVGEKETPVIGNHESLIAWVGEEKEKDKTRCLAAAECKNDVERRARTAEQQNKVNQYMQDRSRGAPRLATESAWSHYNMRAAYQGSLSERHILTFPRPASAPLRSTRDVVPVRFLAARANWLS